MRRTIALCLGVAAVALVAGLGIQLREPSDTSADRPEQEAQDFAGADDSAADTQTGQASAASISSEQAPKVTTISAAYSTASDYFEFAGSIAGRARGGDATAQYYLYAALSYCDEIFRAFFRRPGGRTRTLDEALSRVSTRPAESVEDVRTAHGRCARLFDVDPQQFGGAADWLHRATAQHQPLALMVSAQALLLRADPADAAVQANAKSMLITAVKSKDPEVVWKMGEVQALLDGDPGERDLLQWSWWLAACLRGFDCENSRSLEYSCRFDQLCAQDRDAIDYIRRSTELDFPEVEARARQINANIDSESWDALGLSAP